MAKSIKQAFKDNPISAIALIVTLGNVVIGIVLYIITSQLRPLAQDILTIKAEDQRLEQEITVNTNEHDTFISRDTFNAIVTRIDHISNRVDQIYSLIIK